MRYASKGWAVSSEGEFKAYIQKRFNSFKADCMALGEPKYDENEIYDLGFH